MTKLKEIITLQIGHYSNFVGSHWWNIQESSFCYDKEKAAEVEVDHDVLFREGRNYKGEVTFTPRLIAVDLKGSLGTLRQQGELYNSPYPQNSASESHWSGKVDVYKSEPETRNEFIRDLHQEGSDSSPKTNYQNYDEDKDICHGETSRALASCKVYNLDSSVDVWSDFLQTRLHPRSVILLDDHFHDSNHEPFDVFGVGTQCYQNDKNRDIIEETCRKFAEECNFLQGFQLLVDSYDGFAGVSSSFLEHLNDEYGNKLRTCYPLCKPYYDLAGNMDRERNSEAYRLLNFLFCMDSVTKHSSLFSVLNTGNGTYQEKQHPITLPYLNYKPNLSYHTSAVLATWLENITLPMRLKTSWMSQWDYVHQMVLCGRKFLVSSVCFPLPMRHDDHLFTYLSNPRNIIPLSSLTPNVIIQGESISMQNLVLSGIQQSKVYPEGLHHTQRQPISEMLLKKTNLIVRDSSVNLVHSPTKISHSYPKIFDERINSNGFLGEDPRPSYQVVKEVPVIAGLHNINLSTNLFRPLISSVWKLNLKKHHRFLDAGIDSDEVKDVVNNLECFLDNYDESSSLS